VVNKLGSLLDSGSQSKDPQDHTSDWLLPVLEERGGIEIKDYVVLQKPQEQDNGLSPPRTLILDFTMTHTRYGRSIQHTTGQFTHISRSVGFPEPDGDLQKESTRPNRFYDSGSRHFRSHL
jgi:hypothetical protein